MSLINKIQFGDTTYDLSVSAENVEGEVTNVPVTSVNEKTGDVVLTPSDIGLGTAFKIKGSVETFEDLPTTGNEIGDVYYVESEEVGYIWIEKSSVEQWEQLGLPIDLSNYYTKTESNALLNAKQNTIDNTHKLNSDLVDDTSSSNKFVTTSEKTTWNNKQNTLTAGTNITIEDDVISATASGGQTIQYDEMPEPSAEFKDRIIQYTGEGDESGYFYKCYENYSSHNALRVKRYQFIETELSLSSSHKLEYKFRIDNMLSDNSPLGNMDFSYEDVNIRCGDGDEESMFYFGNGTQEIPSISCYPNTDYDIVFNSNLEEPWLIINGDETEQTTFQSNSNLVLFKNSEETGAIFEGLFYELIITDLNTNTIIHDLIPYKDEDEVACIKDTITDDLYYDNDGGEFEYLEEGYTYNWKKIDIQEPIRYYNGKGIRIDNSNDIDTVNVVYKYDEMPEPSSYYENDLAIYTGEDGDYANNKYYKCVYDENNDEYKWELVNFGGTSTYNKIYRLDVQSGTGNSLNSAHNREVVSQMITDQYATGSASQLHGIPISLIDGNNGTTATFIGVNVSTKPTSMTFKAVCLNNASSNYVTSGTHSLFSYILSIQGTWTNNQFNCTYVSLSTGSYKKDFSFLPEVFNMTNASYNVDYLAPSRIYRSTTDITSLNISYIDGTFWRGEALIWFTSGATPTEITLPKTVINLGDAPTMTESGTKNIGTCEANKKYLIKFYNNDYAEWKKY